MASMFVNMALSSLTQSVAPSIGGWLSTAYQATLGPAGSAIFGDAWTAVEQGGSWLWDKAESGYEWLETTDTGELLKEGFEGYSLYQRYEGIQLQRDRIKELKNLELDIPSMAQFEEDRDEMAAMLETDPDALIGTFGEEALRKYGIDPASIDARAAIEKRGTRQRFEADQASMSRQFARSGVQSSAAMAAAQAQMGIGASAADAQMGLDAEMRFTDQLEGLQDRYQGAGQTLMSMEQQQAQWEMSKLAELNRMEQAYQSGIVTLADKLAQWKPKPKQDNVEVTQDFINEINETDFIDPEVEVPETTTSLAAGDRRREFFRRQGLDIDGNPIIPSQPHDTSGVVTDYYSSMTDEEYFAATGRQKPFTNLLNSLDPAMNQAMNESVGNIGPVYEDPPRRGLDWWETVRQWWGDTAPSGEQGYVIPWEELNKIPSTGYTTPGRREADDWRYK